VRQVFERIEAAPQVPHAEGQPRPEAASARKEVGTAPEPRQPLDDGFGAGLLSLVQPGAFIGGAGASGPRPPTDPRPADLDQHPRQLLREPTLRFLEPLEAPRQRRGI